MFSKKKKATIRSWLTEAGFWWEAGQIVVHDLKPDTSPFYAEGDDVSNRRIIDHDDPILDQDCGYECPRFVAHDLTATYFPVQYDGAVWIEWVSHNILDYLKPGSVTPFPGQS